MGRDTVRFSCHHCNHCCTDVACLPTPWDVARIVKWTGADPYEFLEFLDPDEIEGVDDDDPTWLEFDDNRYMMSLRRDDDGCHFLDKKTKFCTIYESRPILCRLYPFKLQQTRDGKFRGFTLHSDVGCPKHQDGQVPTKPLYDLYLEDDDYQDEYHELIEIFNEWDFEDKEPEDFIGLVLKSNRDVPEMPEELRAARDAGHA